MTSSSLVQWPEGEFSEDISKQIEVNEGSEEHPNDRKNADESATGQVESLIKSKKADGSSAEEGKFFLALEKKANIQKATGPKINDTWASRVTATLRQKPEEV